MTNRHEVEQLGQRLAAHRDAVDTYELVIGLHQACGERGEKQKGSKLHCPEPRKGPTPLPLCSARPSLMMRAMKCRPFSCLTVKPCKAPAFSIHFSPFFLLSLFLQTSGRSLLQKVMLRAGIPLDSMTSWTRKLSSTGGGSCALPKSLRAMVSCVASNARIGPLARIR